MVPRTPQNFNRKTELSPMMPLGFVSLRRTLVSVQTCVHLECCETTRVMKKADSCKLAFGSIVSNTFELAIEFSYPLP
jgi:hypothetical protein